MWLIYRLGFAAPPGSTWEYRVSTDNGETFSAASTILTPGTDMGMYLGASAEFVGGSKIYMTANWEYINDNDRRYNLYYFYLNTVDGHVYSHDGVDMGTSATLAELNTSARLYTSFGSGDISSFASHFDATGKPYILFATNSTGSWQHNFIRWTGSAWTAPQVIRSGVGRYDTADFIVSSPTSISAYLVAPGTGRSIYGGNMERWAWDGATWTLSRVVMRETEPWADHFINVAPRMRPITLFVPWVPLNHNADIEVIFQEFMENDIVDPQGDLRLYAYGPSGFVPTSGNQGGPSIETNADNAQVAAGSFTLANGLGDKFTTSDSDADNWKWNFAKYYSPSAPTINFRDFSGGQFNLNVTTGTTGVISAFNIQGAGTDVSIRYHTVYRAGTEQIPTLALFNEPNAECDPVAESTTVDGIIIRIENTVPTSFVETYTCINGSYTGVGTTDSFAFQGDICLRIQNVTNQWKTYYSIGTTCASWTLDETFSQTISGNLYVVAGLNNLGGSAANYTFDDFSVTAGSLGTNGYRSSGSWTSATQTFAGDVPRTVTVNYTGASASGYIDSVAIVDASGNVLYKDDTDRTAGTTATITVPSSGNLRRNWAVRVSLAGDGSATPTIANIDVAMGIDPTCFSASNGGSLVLSMLPILIGIGLVLAIVAAMKLRQEHHQSGIDLTGIIVVGVSTVVIFVVLSVVYPLVTTLGNGAGC